MTSFIDLNIGTNYLEHLNVVDSLKEIFANAIDEHIMKNIDIENIKFGYKKVGNKNQFFIIDFGDGIMPENFIQKINDNKIKNNNIIGQFGIGLKDAIAYLTNNNVKIVITTNKYIYEPIYKRKNNIDVLHMKCSEHSPEVNSVLQNYDFGTKFSLSGITKKQFEDCLKKFILFDNISNKFTYLVNNKIVLYTDESNNVIYSSDNNGLQSIFINGMQVKSKAPFHYTYDLKRNIELKQIINRDRTDIDIKILKKFVNKILENIQLNEDSEDFFQKIIEIFAQAQQKKELKELGKIDIIRNIIYELNKTGKYIFIDKNDKISSEKIPIVLNSAIKEIFKIKSISSLNDVFYPKNWKNEKIKISTNHQVDNIKIIEIIADFLSKEILFRPFDKNFVNKLFCEFNKIIKNNIESSSKNKIIDNDDDEYFSQDESDDEINKICLNDNNTFSIDDMIRIIFFDIILETDIMFSKEDKKIIQLKMITESEKINNLRAKIKNIEMIDIHSNIELSIKKKQVNSINSNVLEIGIENITI
jgi:hypothetical protein